MDSSQKKKNRLAGASSPYLRQHAENPVDWYPWADSAFERARMEDKPVLVSIGYAACHWCHVMESESFEDPILAKWMNAHFICIKVDREEHPDIDQFYMEAAQALSGSGGWPLNVFVDADRQPFFAGTYFPPRPMRSIPSWRQVLDWVLEIWNNRRQDIALQATQLTQLIQGAQHIEMPKGEPVPPESWAKAMGEQIMKSADRRFGGWGTAPKFPSAVGLRLLIEASYFQADQEYWHQAVLSLNQMMRGGIYDQLGGGFCRYSTDAQWALPHFEKMLYDNAQLVETYSLAYQREPRREWARVIRQTIEFVESELKSAQGGYDSSLDADSEGQEGKYYSWTGEDLRESIPDAPAWMESYFQIPPKGNGQDPSPLRRPYDPAEFALQQGLDQEDMEYQVARVLDLLKEKRKSRIPPARADQRILSWNALWNLALTRAGIALGHEPYLDRAEEHMNWIRESFCPFPGQWKRILGRGGVSIEANLGDLAALISAMFALACRRNKSLYLGAASALLEEVVIPRFSDEQDRFFHLVAKAHQRVPVTRTEREDLTMPSSNALMAHNLILAAMIFSRYDYLDRAESMLEAMRPLAMRYPASFGYWAILIQRKDRGWTKLSIKGPEAREWQRQLSAHLWPQVYVEGPQEWEGSPGTGITEIQVCRTRDCLPPVRSREEAISLMEDRGRSFGGK